MTSSYLPPPPGATALVSLIDSTTRIGGISTSYFLAGPSIPGFTHLPILPAWSFLISSSAGGKALFDLAVPPDWETSFAPALSNLIRSTGWSVNATKHVSEILTDNDVELGDINSIIWSHPHFDHIGDPSSFPHTTNLVVGPGFKKEFLPAYPTNPESQLQERYFDGRQLIEIDFNTHPHALKIGVLRAFDFFGDGSFYLLDTPGHAIGHMSGLVRTAREPDSFVFLGGDVVHHGGELRPSARLRMPKGLALGEEVLEGACGCPGGMMAKSGRGLEEPFFEPGMGHDLELARKSITDVQSMDERKDVLFLFAHDATIVGLVDVFPKTLNGWKEKGWKQEVLWRFLEDFEGGKSKDK